MQPVAAVTAKHFITAIAGQRHSHFAPRQLTNAVSGNGRAVGIRLVIEPRQRVDQIEIVAANGFDIVIGLVLVGHHFGEFDFIESRVVKTHRAGVHRGVRQAGHGGHHSAGVHTARQKCTQWHLGNHSQPHRLFEFGVELLARLIQTHRVTQGESHIPIRFGRWNGLATAYGQGVGRRQFERLFKDGAWLGHITQREVLFNGQRVHLAFEPAVGQQRLQFRAEEQVPVVEHRVIHRLDRHAVACHEKGLFVSVPQRKREHAAEAFDTGLAPSFPSVHDAFGVTLGMEDVTQRLQLRDQVLIVVDLTIEHHHHGTVFVEQRLLSRGHIDDGQATVSQAHARLEVQAAFVGTAVKLRLVHAVQHRMRDLAVAAGVENACDAAHRWSSSLIYGVSAWPLEAKPLLWPGDRNCWL